MTSLTTEIVLMWVAVTAYAAGSVLFVAGYVFGLQRMRPAAIWVSLAGAVPQAVALGIRWVRVGHAPYLGFYEVVTGLALPAVIVFGLLVLRYRQLAPSGVLIMPLAFLMLGGAMFAPKGGLEVTGKLASWWLTIHVSFAKLSYACFIASFALGLLYVMRERWTTGTWGDVLAKMPPPEIVDDLNYKCVAAGFIFLGIMIAAGAIWANEAWGRYWGWDPIETWSLIAWIIYAVVLHLRLTMGWRGKRFAWLTIAALPVMLFSLVGVPIVYNSIHGAYLTGVNLTPGK